MTPSVPAEPADDAPAPRQVAVPDIYRWADAIAPEAIEATIAAIDAQIAQLTARRRLLEATRDLYALRR